LKRDMKRWTNTDLFLDNFDTEVCK